MGEKLSKYPREDQNNLYYATDIQVLQSLNNHLLSWVAQNGKVYSINQKSKSEFLKNIILPMFLLKTAKNMSFDIGLLQASRNLRIFMEQTSFK